MMKAGAVAITYVTSYVSRQRAGLTYTLNIRPKTPLKDRKANKLFKTQLIHFGGQKQKIVQEASKCRRMLHLSATVGFAIFSIAISFTALVLS